MIIVFLGPPGSGKGTQAKQLNASRHLPHLSTGDMLRSAIQEGSQLGLEAKARMDQGQLVPDSVVVGLIAEKSRSPECRDGFILDGFPRNIPQAEALDRMLQMQGRNVDQVIFFDVAEEKLIRRLSGRRTCSRCGAMYHLDHAQPKREGICNQCGSQLIQRDDDHVEVVKNRLDVYRRQTEPLVGFYTKQGKLCRLDAGLPASEVSNVLAEILK